MAKARHAPDPLRGKSRRGTEVASILYSLVETAKLHGIDPARYLREAALADKRGEVLLLWQLES